MMDQLFLPLFIEATTKVAFTPTFLIHFDQLVQFIWVGLRHLVRTKQPGVVSGHSQVNFGAFPNWCER